MSLPANTLLCNVMGRTLSIPSVFGPLCCDPLGNQKLSLQKEILRENALDGNDVFKIFPELSEHGLAAFIEEQIYREHSQCKVVFAKPYCLL